MPYGKYRDVPVCDVPQDYLAWFLANCKVSSGLRAAMREELVRRGTDPATLPPKPAEKPQPQCRRCGGTELRLSWQPLSNTSNRMIRGDCRRCDVFVSYVAQTDANVSEANVMSRSSSDSKPQAYDGAVLWGCTHCGTYQRAPQAPARCPQCRHRAMVLVDAHPPKPLAARK
jgi:hypothetical protein